MSRCFAWLALLCLGLSSLGCPLSEDQCSPPQLLCRPGFICQQGECICAPGTRRRGQCCCKSLTLTCEPKDGICYCKAPRVLNGQGDCVCPAAQECPGAAVDCCEAGQRCVARQCTP